MNILKTAYYAFICALPAGWEAFKIAMSLFPSAEALPRNFTVDIDITVEMQITGE